MIIKLLFNLITGIILLIPFNIPQMPSGVSNLLTTYFGYLNSGVTLIGNFVHMDYLRTLVMAALGIEAAIDIYKFVMWVLRKIPMLNVKD